MSILAGSMPNVAVRSRAVLCEIAITRRAIWHVRAVNKRGLKNKDATIRNLARGWTMSLMALSLVATTVHLWNVPFTFFFFFVGTAGWIADPAKVRAKAKKPATAKPEAGAHGGAIRVPQGPGPAPAYPLPPLGNGAYA